MPGPRTGKDLSVGCTEILAYPSRSKETPPFHPEIVWPNARHGVTETDPRTAK